MQSLIKKILKNFNIGITTYGNLLSLREYSDNIEDILNLPADKLAYLGTYKTKSKSQLRQDLFALLENDFKRNGFFVEFGATNGIDLSNTYLLEKEFGWSGILAEPAKIWHHDLKLNRSCSIDTDCVWSKSNTLLEFNEVSVGELSTISRFNGNDWAKKERRSGLSYKVNTISLLDLLRKYHAPKLIDYLSIDTEGSEYEILSNFDFNEFQFNVITCEHNFTPMREKIYKLLVNNGYKRKYVGFSKWDDWYIKA